MRIESRHLQDLNFMELISAFFGLTSLCPNRPKAAKEINAYMYVVFITSVTNIESIKSRYNIKSKYHSSKTHEHYSIHIWFSLKKIYRKYLLLIDVAELCDLPAVNSLLL